jgi:hypothetical protein
VSSLRWVIGAALLGFGSSTLLSSVLQFSRDRFIAFHAVVVTAFILAYVRSEGIDVTVQLRRRWVSGLIGGILVGALLARTVLNQPGSPQPAGAGLARALLWDGALYGSIDALLLSVLPVLAVYGSRPAAQLRNPVSRWLWGLSALLASLFITAAYHLGFAEFRGPSLLAPLIGNAIVTMTYLATGSPIAALLSHAVMHGAAVLHGMASTVQLPPHY